MRRVIIAALFLVLALALSARASIVLDETAERLLNNVTNLPMPTTGSLVYWINPTFVQTDNTSHVFFFGPSTLFAQATGFTGGIKSTDNKFYFGWHDGTTDHRIAVSSGSYTLNQNAWNVVVGTWDDTANQTYLYLNGTQIGSQTSTLVTIDTTDTVIGPPFVISSVNCNCLIAEVGIYNVVLTAEEINSLSSGISPNCVTRGLVDYVSAWRYDDATTSLVDPRFGSQRWVHSIPQTTATWSADHPAMRYCGKARYFQ